MMSRIVGIDLAVWVCLLNPGFPAQAQNSTNINLNLSGSTLSFAIEGTVLIGQTGNVVPLGNADLTVMSSSQPVVNNSPAGPVQMAAVLAFNEADTLNISFTLSDPNFLQKTPIVMPGGVIVGGTGAYAGAAGSLDISLVNFGVTGSGTMILGGSTTGLTLSNFQGQCCGRAAARSTIFNLPLNVTGNLGSGSGTMVGYTSPTTPSPTTIGTATINFNSDDSLTLWFAYVPAGNRNFGNSPSTFNGVIAAGTGRFVNATGPLSWTATSGGFSVSGTMTTAPGAQITKVSTIYGLPEIALNTWLEIQGNNLVPADTPSAGVDWSKAPEFANGMMPTQLGPISVNFGANSVPGYVYYYCSAATNPICAVDQINVLAPLVGGTVLAGPQRVIVENNGVPIATTTAFRDGFSPALLAFDAVGHVVAQHADYSLVGPLSLYPGLTKPAKPGEPIILYATGFGQNGTLVEGSATQSGTIGQVPCWVSGMGTTGVGAVVSPGLYQVNLTLPGKGLPSGDQPVVCRISAYSTFPGAVIAIQ